jgi:hypothetical protein
MPGKRDTFTPKQNRPAPALLSSMVQSTVDYWQTATRQMFAAMHAGNGQKPRQEYRARPLEPYSPESFQQLFDLSFATMLKNGPAGAWTQQQQRTPLVAMKLFEDGFEHLNRLLQEISNGMHLSARGPSQIDRQTPALGELLRACAKNFEKGISFPKLGLNRCYQERLTQAMITFNDFTLVSGEFSMLMLQPVESAFIKMRATLKEMAKGNGYSTQVKDYYAIWIKILEKDYLMLLSSPGFIVSFHSLIDKYNSFHASCEQVMQDWLQFLPVTTKKDMQAVYKENHLMKKEIRVLTRRLESIEQKVLRLEENSHMDRREQRSNVSTLRLQGGKAK